MPAFSPSTWEAEAARLSWAWWPPCVNSTLGRQWESWDLQAIMGYVVKSEILQS